MVAVTPSEMAQAPEGAVDQSGEAPRLRLLPAVLPFDRGIFDRALRAAALLWQPQRIELPEPASDGGAIIALPAVLEAWRATERELAGMTGDGPAQELLAANALFLRAMYQRLYRERMRK